MATLTLTVADAQVPRIQAAMQTVMGLDTLPSANDIRVFLIEYLKFVVLEEEARQAAKQAEASATPLDVT